MTERLDGTPRLLPTYPTVRTWGNACQDGQGEACPFRSRYGNCNLWREPLGNTPAWKPGDGAFVRDDKRGLPWTRCPSCLAADGAAEGRLSS